MAISNNLNGLVKISVGLVVKLQLVLKAQAEIYGLLNNLVVSQFRFHYKIIIIAFGQLSQAPYCVIFRVSVYPWFIKSGSS